MGKKIWYQSTIFLWSAPVPITHFCIRDWCRSLQVKNCFYMRIFCHTEPYLVLGVEVSVNLKQTGDCPDVFTLLDWPVEVWSVAGVVGGMGHPILASLINVESESFPVWWDRGGWGVLRPTQTRNKFHLPSDTRHYTLTMPRQQGNENQVFISTY